MDDGLCPPQPNPCWAIEHGMIQRIVEPFVIKLTYAHSGCTKSTRQYNSLLFMPIGINVTATGAHEVLYGLLDTGSNIILIADVSCTQTDSACPCVPPATAEHLPTHLGTIRGVGYGLVDNSNCPVFNSYSTPYRLGQPPFSTNLVKHKWEIIPRTIKGCVPVTYKQCTGKEGSFTSCPWFTEQSANGMCLSAFGSGRVSYLPVSDAIIIPNKYTSKPNLFIRCLYMGIQIQQTDFPYTVPGIVGFSHYKALGGTLMGTVCKDWPDEGVNNEYTTFRLFEAFGRGGCLTTTQEFKLALWEDSLGSMEGELVLQPQWSSDTVRMGMVHHVLPFYGLHLVAVTVGSLTLHLTEKYNVMLLDTGT